MESMGGFELPVEVVVLVLHALGLDLRLQRPSHMVVRASTACVDEEVLALFYCVAGRAIGVVLMWPESLLRGPGERIHCDAKAIGLLSRLTLRR